MARIIKFALFIILLTATAILSQTTPPRRINVGYFEAGKYPINSVVRDEYFRQLEAVLPDSFQVVAVPEGYRSADWKRDDCKSMAYQLAAIPHLDMVIAVGPWVVEDLIAAGFDKPIIALHQFEPRVQGLLDSTNRPIVPNLTVSYQFHKIERDLATIKQLTNAKKLGFLYFPSGDESESMLNLVTNLAKIYDMEVYSAEGYDNYGTFAFFKAFAEIKAHLDAIYLTPMFGFDPQKLTDFLGMLKDKHIPAFTAEGNMMLERDGFATNDFYGVITASRFNAVKTVQILEGATPADLPVTYSTEGSLGINLQTAAVCEIEIPTDLLAKSYLIPAENPELTQAYTLNDAVNRVLTQNPSFLAETDLIDLAQAETKIAKSSYLPQVSADFNYLRLDDKIVENTFDRLDQNQSWGGIHLEQKLFSAATLMAIKVARQNEKLADNSMAQKKLTLELLTSLAFIDVDRGKDILSAYENHRNIVEHNLEIARAKNQFEGADTLDVLLLESEKHALTEKILTARDQLENYRVVLNKLFNLPANEPFNIDSSAFSETAYLNHELNIFNLINTKSDRNRLADKLYLKAKATSPKIQEHDLQINLSRAQLDQNKATFLPEIGLRADFNLHDNWNEFYLDENKTSWTVGGFVRLPLFLGGERFQKNKALKSQLNRAEYGKDESSLDLMENIYTGINSLANNAEKLTPAFRAKNVSFQALEGAINKYSASQYEINDLIRTQQKALDNELRFILNRYDYYIEMAYLIYHSGRPVSDSYSNFIDQFHQLAEY